MSKPKSMPVRRKKTVNKTSTEKTEMLVDLVRQTGIDISGIGLETMRLSKLKPIVATLKHAYDSGRYDAFLYLNAKAIADLHRQPTN